MRRLAFLAAASLAFIAISEPISAEENYGDARVCMDFCMWNGGDRDCCKDKCLKDKVRRKKQRLGNKLRC